MPIPAQLLVAVATLFIAIASVLLHYEAFLGLTRSLARWASFSRRQRILVLVFCLLLVHAFEILLFGVTAWFLLRLEGTGQIVSGYELVLLDHLYLSAVTFSTVGYGDLLPRGPIRFLYATEGLVGFALITWSASLTFLEMQRHWRDD